MDYTIKTVDITNLLGRNDIHWELYPDVNILGGPNGSGKSTILRAIYKAISSPAVFVKDNFRPFSSIAIQFTDNEFSISLPGTIGKVQHTKDPEGKDFSKPPKTDSGCALPPDSRFSVIYVNSADQIASDTALFVNESDLSDKGDITYLDLLIERELRIYNRQFTQLTQSILRSDSNNKAESLMELQAKADKFGNTLRKFMPQYRITDMSSLRFEYRTANGSKADIPFTRLSTGEKQLVYLLLTATNTLENHALLLLDEADLGMHIDWKEILIKALREINHNMQIIAATHSPALIEGWNENVREISQITVNN